MENLLLYDNIILNKWCLNRFISANYVKASFFLTIPGCHIYNFVHVVVNFQDIGTITQFKKNSSSVAAVVISQPIF